MLLFTETYVSYMKEVAAAAPGLPFYLYDNAFMTGITCKHHSQTQYRKHTGGSTIASGILNIHPTPVFL